MAAAVRTVHLASSWSRQTLDDRGDGLWIVGGMDAERVPRLVIERQVVPEHDLAGIFFGPLPIEAERAFETRPERRAGSERCRRSLRFWRARGCRCGRAGARRRRDELLEHVRRFLAARHAAG